MMWGCFSERIPIHLHYHISCAISKQCIRLCLVYFFRGRLCHKEGFTLSSQCNYMQLDIYTQSCLIECTKGLLLQFRYNQRFTIQQKQHSASEIRCLFIFYYFIVYLFINLFLILLACGSHRSYVLSLHYQLVWSQAPAKGFVFASLRSAKFR